MLSWAKSLLVGKPGEEEKRAHVTVVYATDRGTARTFAEKLGSEGADAGVDVDVVSVADYDVDALSDETFVIFILSTFTGGTVAPAGKAFFYWLEDMAQDQRAGNMLRGVRYALFGLGDSNYGDDYCRAVRTADKWLRRVGGKNFFARGEGDMAGDQPAVFAKWSKYMWPALVKAAKRQWAEAAAAAKAAEAEGGVESDEDDEDDAGAESSGDMEDLGEGDDDDEDGTGEADPSKPRKEMVSEGHRASLTKSGYKIIGSHSAVKLCRWTKAMLRGRGGCYKHTFYGISSYQCMELTPSLACANKCVFCWRHHRNPVGTNWRWAMDNADFIVERACEQHRGMIKQLRGMPGVIPSRFQDAMNIRHCALSLVGEPIIYPEINAFLGHLHDKAISTFMVTNAQFPEQMESLVPVTQLYVSIDAPNKEALAEVDRPIFKDFWQRFLDSIDVLRAKGQRTVFRLTLVKGFNMTDVDEYCELIRRGRPQLIEIKGVTFCGGGADNPLTMKNVPWHEEVISFCKAISDGMDGEYEIACEHEHSCCVLLAEASKFKIDGSWHTWIDFDKFIELQASGEPFSTFDYMQETPAWAQYGAKERGFDPDETRWRRGDGAKPYMGQGC